MENRFCTLEQARILKKRLDVAEARYNEIKDNSNDLKEWLEASKDYMQELRKIKRSISDQ